jgi:nucleoside 2-deoxyribosyltransferase
MGKIMKKPKAYLAGPYGFSEAGRSFYHEMFIPLIIKAGFDVLDPWSLTPSAVVDVAAGLPYGEERRERWREVNRVIGENNARAIRSADLIVAVLDGPDVESGTAAEIGYGAALGKPVLGYRGDFRQAADNEGSTVNLQVEYFILASGGGIVSTLDLLRTELERFKDRLPPR